MKPHTQLFVWVWLSGAVILTGLCLGLYAVGQQNYRQSVNDPQIQLAEDAAAKLNAGAVPADIVTRSQQLVDIKNSLDPWVAVYDANGTPLEASGQLNNAPPQPPKDLFNQSTWNTVKVYTSPAGDETRVTWQPQPDVRQSLILVHAQNNLFVAAGRSMRTTEDRIIQLSINMLLGWLALEAAWVVAMIGGWFILKTKTRGIL